MSIKTIMILITLVFVIAIGYIACSIISPDSCNPKHNITPNAVDSTLEEEGNISKKL